MCLKQPSGHIHIPHHVLCNKLILSFNRGLSYLWLLWHKVCTYWQYVRAAVIHGPTPALESTLPHHFPFCVPASQPHMQKGEYSWTEHWLKDGRATSRSLPWQKTPQWQNSGTDIVESPNLTRSFTVEGTGSSLSSNTAAILNQKSDSESNFNLQMQ